ncbi:MAG: CDP-alcohol phosphatidyltransferase family protein [Candidatus Poribacteria bacterium]|nr:CDP-alcohol phosphatidyltransferase family protein [Candidatus Poribacteria bacterium]
MIANLITLFRLILVFVVISLFGQHLYLDILLVALIGLILFLDAVDGYVARKLNQTSDFGALLDIVGDRIVECIFWVYFAVVGLIPIWIPVIVIARGFFTDGLRSAAFAQGKTAFGENTMMSSKWTRALTSSRMSRSIYGIAKTIAFIYLGGLIAFKNSGVYPELTVGLELTGVILSTITVAMCLIRGLPVLIDGWKYVKN